MNLSTSLDIAIGLLLIFLLGSLAVSGFTELFAYLTKKRSKELWKSIHRLLDPTSPPNDPRPVNDGGETNDPIAQAIYDSPLITEFRTVAEGTRTQMAKIASSDFVQALLQSRVPNRAALNDQGTIDALKATLPADAPLRDALEAFADEAKGDLVKVVARLESWFDTQMDRVSHVYKRYARWIALVVGLAVAAIANINVIYIAETLNRDQATRAAFSKGATKLVNGCDKRPADQTLTDCVKEQQLDLGDTVEVPFGWIGKAVPAEVNGWTVLWIAAGWILAGLAFMQGAPFWFDLMKRLVGMRGGSQSP